MGTYLDKNPEFGDYVDCTSNYEVEQQEMANRRDPIILTPHLWIIKMLLGAIDGSYDIQDE